MAGVLTQAELTQALTAFSADADVAASTGPEIDLAGNAVGPASDGQMAQTGLGMQDLVVAGALEAGAASDATAEAAAKPEDPTPMV